MSANRTEMMRPGEGPRESVLYGVQAPSPLEAMLRHKRLAASLALGILGLTVAVILFSPRTYRSTTKLLLKLGKESTTLDPTATTTGETLSVHRTRESEVLTVLEVMSSREILDGVVGQIGEGPIISGALPGSGPPKKAGLLSSTLGPLKRAISEIDPIDDRERAIVELEGSLRLSAPDEAGVATIEYRTKTPELAQRVLDEWVDLFQEHYLASTRTRGAFEFFEEQDRLLTEQLTALRGEIADAKNRFGLVTIDGQQRQLEEQVQTVRISTLQVQSQMAETRSRIGSLTDLGETIPLKTVTQAVKGKPNQALDEMRAQLYELQVEEKRLASFMAEGHPMLQAVRDQLTSASEVLEAEGPQNQRSEQTEAINPVRLVVDEKLALERAELEALREKANALAEQEKMLLGDLASLNDHERVIRDLERRLQIVEDRYRSHSQRFEQARLDRALEADKISSVNIVQSPTLERRPVSPRKKLCFILGFAATIAACFGVPMWIESGRSANMQLAALSDLTQPEPEPRTAIPSSVEQADLSPTTPR